ncbi:IPT/TIG domain-containing protein [Jatrophihabitans fulvus]
MRSRLSTTVVVVVATVAATVALPSGADAAARRPAVTSVSPSVVSNAGGARVTVKGSGFVKGATVRFGSSAGRSVSVLSSTTLKVTAPAHAVGSVDVRVKTAAGTSAIGRRDRVQYVARPFVTSLSPATGSFRGGQTITVRGRNFTRVTAVDFGTKRSPAVTVRSSSTLLARVPSGNAGAKSVRVVNAAGASAPKAFVYTTSATWRAPTSVLPQSGWLNAASCPTEAFCAAADGTGNVLFRRDGTWSAPVAVERAQPGSTQGAAINAVTCSSSAFCMAVGRFGTYRWDGTSWTTVTASEEFTAVACASPAQCFAVEDGSRDGRNDILWRYDGSGWATVDDFFAGARLSSLTCSGPSFCALVSPDEWNGESSDRVFVWNGAAWGSGTAPDGFAERIAGLSCPTAEKCVMVAEGGATYLYSTGTWSPEGDLARPEDDYLYDFACATTSRCWAAYGTYNPPTALATFDGSSWSAVTGDVADDVTRLACDPSACFGVGTDSVTPLSPTDGPGTPTSIDPYTGGVADVDCPTSAFCVAVGSGRTAVWRGGAWTAGPSTTADLRAVSCASGSFCVAVSAQGRATRWNGNAWTLDPGLHAPTATDSTGGLTSVSCTSTTFCMAVDGRGNAWTFNGTTWTKKAAVVRPGYPLVSCAGRFCLVGDDAHVRKYSNGVWSAPTSPSGTADRTSAIDCVSASACLLALGSGKVLRWNGRAWTRTLTVPFYVFGYGADLTCASATWCVLASRGYNGPSDVAPDGIWHFDGADWTSQHSLTVMPGAISCPTSTFCAAGDEHGFVQTYR